MPTDLCPKCGSHAPLPHQLQKVGCAHCYQAFFPIFERIAEWYHGKNYHIGKMPLDYSERSVVLVELYREALAKARSEGRIEAAKGIEILLSTLGKS